MDVNVSDGEPLVLVILNPKLDSVFYPLDFDFNWFMFLMDLCCAVFHICALCNVLARCICTVYFLCHASQIRVSRQSNKQRNATTKYGSSLFLRFEYRITLSEKPINTHLIYTLIRTQIVTIYIYGRGTFTPWSMHLRGKKLFCVKESNRFTPFLLSPFFF